MHSIQAIILAAGMSSRFGADVNKLTVPLCGKPLIMHVIGLLESENIPVSVVVGHQKEHVIETIIAHAQTDITFVEQIEQKGTGHAVMCSREHWYADNVLVLNGDMPLLNTKLIQTLCHEHTKQNATVSFIASYPDNPNHAYGRVIQENGIMRIVEAKDFTGDKTKNHPINAGIYIFKRTFLQEYIDQLTTQNVSNELYLTDLIELASAQKKHIVIGRAPFNTVRGVNTQEEYYDAVYLKQVAIIQHWMHHGVRFQDPKTAYIDTDSTIGRGTIIGAGTQLHNTHVGNNCTVDAYSIVRNTTTEDHVIIHPHCVIDSATLGAHTTVGPCAHLRNNVVTKEHVAVGNFVEVKKSTLGAHTKAKHLTYLGDTTTGQNVNVGAGTVTCNYDGINKHYTTIKDNAFVGSNNTIVAPLTIEDGAYTAAGSTITQDVPINALAIGRARQMNKQNYAEKLRNKTQASVAHVANKKPSTTDNAV